MDCPARGSRLEAVAIARRQGTCRLWAGNGSAHVTRVRAVIPGLRLDKDRGSTGDEYQSPAEGERRQVGNVEYLVYPGRQADRSAGPGSGALERHAGGRRFVAADKLAQVAKEPR